MLNKQTVHEFLARDLRNYDWLKKIKPEKLDAELKMLRPQPQFNGVKLWSHQKAGLLLALELKRFMFFLDMGAGKTLLSLTLLKYLKQCGQKPKAIVFVPYLTSVETWVEEVQKHTPDLACVPLLGTTAQNLKRLNGKGDLFVICYQSAVAMLSNQTVTRYGKSGWNFKAEDIRERFGSFNMLICDEIHRCFVAGTMISTPSGCEPIESLRVGDLVNTSAGVEHITAVMQSTSVDLVHVSLENGVDVTCTWDHPFLTEDGWKKAETLEGKDVLFLATQSTHDLSPVWQPVLGNTISSTSGQEILQHQLCKEAPQSNAGPNSSQESVHQTQAAGAWPREESSRQRPWSDKAAKLAAESPRGWLGPRVQCISETPTQGLPDLLQIGPRKQGTKTWHRAGFLQDVSKTETSSQKGPETIRTRVVGVSHKKQSSPVTVYNIEVANTPNYFANGILVHNCKNPTSLTYRMCKAISSTAEYVLGLTGTPFGNDLLDLWPQFHLIDFGETLGPTLSFYRSVFFSSKAGYWGGQDYKFKKSLMPDLQRLIKNRSIRYSVDEFYDMPSKEYCRRTLGCSQAALGWVEQCKGELKDAVKDGSYRAAENSYLRLRQLSSGFMTLYGEDSDKLEVEFDENPKLDALEEILTSVPADCRVVVFHHFRYTSAIISKRLKELKIHHAVIHGGVRDPVSELRKFKQDPKCQVMVINWKSGSSSLNLQNASYMVVYEQPDSPIDRKQGEARLWRPGQTRRVMIYDLLIRGTVDERMLIANQAGKKLLDELLEGNLDE